MNGSRFPFADRPRLWGVAVSHYQVEGNDPCDWTDWESAGRTRGAPCGAAAGSWSRYEEDVDLVVSAGANAFRFSVSWSRIEPERGRFDDAALSRYRRVVDHCVARGVEPVVTLFHYTHPRWFDRDNLWTRTGSVELFARFARVVGQALGDRARVYTLLNEPLVFLLAGFIDAQIPPGVANPRDARKALDHLLAAHVAGAQALREVNPGVAIGVAHNMMGFAPLRRRNLFDRMLSRMAGWFYNEGLWEAFATGKWNLFLPPATWFRGSRPDLVGSIDFAGVNFYSRLHLRFPGRERWYGDFTYLDRSGRGLTDNGWEIVPELLEPMLLTASSLGLPVMVTENGLADARDQIRGQFLSDHLEAIERAALRGVSVAGYFHWSLLDNYEWLDGFGPRFGLYDLDPSTLVRTARPSVRTFRDLGRRFLAGSLTP